MTDSHKSEIATHQRRAAALIAHYGNDRIDGMNAILVEAQEAGQVTQLILGVLSLYHELIPELRTQTGMHLMGEHVLRLAQQETP